MDSCWAGLWLKFFPFCDFIGLLKYIFVFVIEFVSEFHTEVKLFRLDLLQVSLFLSCTFRHFQMWHVIESIICATFAILCTILLFKQGSSKDLVVSVMKIKNILWRNFKSYMLSPADLQPGTLYPFLYSF